MLVFVSIIWISHGFFFEYLLVVGWYIMYSIIRLLNFFLFKTRLCFGDNFCKGKTSYFELHIWNFSWYLLFYFFKFRINFMFCENGRSECWENIFFCIKSFYKKYHHINNYKFKFCIKLVRKVQKTHCNIVKWTFCIKNRPSILDYSRRHCILWKRCRHD